MYKLPPAEGRLCQYKWIQAGQAAEVSFSLEKRREGE